ncbi:AbrB/MazE/SpoVT family DNA-binding domain-containing protein, partial [Bacillus bingmayongensis]
MELRRTLGIKEKEPMEIFVEDDKIILQKYQWFWCKKFKALASN